MDILSITQTELLFRLKKGVLITPNIDHLVKLQKDKEFYNVYQQAEWVICDSKILYFVSKLLKRSFQVVVFLLHFINIIKMIRIVKYFYWEQLKESL